MGHATRRSSRSPRASRQRRALRPRAWLLAHLQALIYSLGHLYRNAVGSLMTCAVIGITVALPAGLYTALDNLSVITDQWHGGQQITLYLHIDTNQPETQRLADQLRLQPDIFNTRVISAEAALNEYRASSGVSDLLAGLEFNPLPNLIVVEPAPMSSTTELMALKQVLESEAQVEFAQFDLEWLERLQAILAIAKRGILILSALLGLAVLLIVGNTIRLSIFNRREEIAIGKLFGATNPFIQRPFLYSGLLYGAIGGLIACILVGISFILLNGPVARLVQLYDSQFRLTGLAGQTALLVMILSCLLGLVGAWMSVHRHIRRIEPE